MSSITNTYRFAQTNRCFCRTLDHSEFDKRSEFEINLVKLVSEKLIITLDMNLRRARIEIHENYELLLKWRVLNVYFGTMSRSDVVKNLAFGASKTIGNCIYNKEVDHTWYGYTLFSYIIPKTIVGQPPKCDYSSAVKKVAVEVIVPEVVVDHKLKKMKNLVFQQKKAEQWKKAKLFNLTAYGTWINNQYRSYAELIKTEKVIPASEYWADTISVHYHVNLSIFVENKMRSTLGSTVKLHAGWIVDGRNVVSFKRFPMCYSVHHAWVASGSKWDKVCMNMIGPNVKTGSNKWISTIYDNGNNLSNVALLLNGLIVTTYGNDMLFTFEKRGQLVEKETLCATIEIADKDWKGKNPAPFSDFDVAKFSLRDGRGLYHVWSTVIYHPKTGDAVVVCSKLGARIWREVCGRYTRLLQALVYSTLTDECYDLIIEGASKEAVMTVCLDRMNRWLAFIKQVDLCRGNEEEDYLIYTPTDFNSAMNLRCIIKNLLGVSSIKYWNEACCGIVRDMIDFISYLSYDYRDKEDNPIKYNKFPTGRYSDMFCYETRVEGEIRESAGADSFWKQVAEAEAKKNCQ